MHNLSDSRVFASKYQSMQNEYNATGDILLSITLNRFNDSMDFDVYITLCLLIKNKCGESKKSRAHTEKTNNCIFFSFCYLLHANKHIIKLADIKL